MQGAARRWAAAPPAPGSDTACRHPIPRPLPRRGEGEIRAGPHVARHLVRIDEVERRRPLAQELVDEGGLPGAVGAGEEDGGGHGGCHA